jgi:hypothetical protein
MERFQDPFACVRLNLVTLGGLEKMDKKNRFHSVTRRTINRFFGHDVTRKDPRFRLTGGWMDRHLVNIANSLPVGSKAA